MEKMSLKSTLTSFRGADVDGLNPVARLREREVDEILYTHTQIDDTYTIDFREPTSVNVSFS